MHTTLAPEQHGEILQQRTRGDAKQQAEASYPRSNKNPAKCVCQ